MKLSPAELNRHFQNEIKKLYKEIDEELNSKLSSEFKFKPITDVAAFTDKAVYGYTFELLNSIYQLLAVPKAEVAGMYIETRIQQMRELDKDSSDIAVPELKIRYRVEDELYPMSNEPIFTCWFNSDIKQEMFSNRELAERYADRFLAYLKKKAELDLNAD